MPTTHADLHFLIGVYDQIALDQTHPPGFSRPWCDDDESTVPVPDDGYDSLCYRRGEQIYYKDVLYTRRTDVAKTGTLAVLYGIPMRGDYASFRYSEKHCLRLYTIEEVLAPNFPYHSDKYALYVFRVGDRWYQSCDYLAYMEGDDDLPSWSTAQEAVDDHMESNWPTWKEDIFYEEIPEGDIREGTLRLRIRQHAYGQKVESFVESEANKKRKDEEERLAKEAERLAAEKKARREAEDAEMAALEAELADLERQEKLKQLRAKVAQMKEK
jgi:hypothetical protein